MTALTKIGLVFVSTPEVALGMVEVEDACDKTPHPRNRKSDHGVARHVTLGMFIAFMAATFGPIVAMQAWTIQVANEAKIAAASARPFPYTSQDAERNWDAHRLYHQEHDALIKDITAANLGRIEERLQGKIENLPRPPQAIIELLNDLRTRITKLEVLIKDITTHQADKQ